MNTILKIEPFVSDPNKILVTVEGFPHSQPVLDNNLTQEELQMKVDAWAIIQLEIDSINNGTASQDIIDKHKPKAIDLFDPEIAISREAQVFPIDRIIALAPFTYTINELLRKKNIVQLKQVIGGLVQGGIATVDDYTKFAAILMEQNVNLSDY